MYQEDDLLFSPEELARLAAPSHPNHRVARSLSILNACLITEENIDLFLQAQP